MSATMTLHRGAVLASRDELNGIATPEETATWKPTGHADAVNIVEHCLTTAGFSIRKTCYALTRDKARLFATLDLTTQLAEGVSLAVGIRNSIDKSLPMGFAAGNRVFVCDNLAFSAELIVKSRHTKNGRQTFREQIINGIAGLDAHIQTEKNRLDRMMTFPMNDTLAESIILRAYEQEIIGTPQIADLVKRWRKPEFEFFKPRTAFSLFNAFTSCMSCAFGSNPQRYNAATMRLTGLFWETQGTSDAVPMLPSRT